MEKLSLREVSGPVQPVHGRQEGAGAWVGTLRHGGDRLSTCPWARLLGRGAPRCWPASAPWLGSNSHCHQRVSSSAHCSRAAVVESELPPFIECLDQSPIGRDKPVPGFSFLFSFSGTCSHWDHHTCGPRGRFHRRRPLPSAFAPATLRPARLRPVGVLGEQSVSAKPLFQGPTLEF
uniref:Uncharacterized protein n=1 Tax=Myotis myotis TaxID=51298 RepID=A0A7J7Z5C3_MYOMY|nr:hypothetical protein mMyoMyo1_010789 [Myotis myotis]